MKELNGVLMRCPDCFAAMNQVHLFNGMLAELSENPDQRAVCVVIDDGEHNVIPKRARVNCARCYSKGVILTPKGCELLQTLTDFTNPAADPERTQ